VRIAIIGSGVSGLVAAHALHRRHEVTVFEADTRIGGHSHTVDVELPGERHAVDTGFIVYNERTYPSFTRLLEGLGVESQPSDMSFSVACDRTGLEWASRGLGAVFAQRRNLARPGFLGMLREVLRFNRESRSLLEAAEEKVSLGDWLCGGGYSTRFVEHYVIPVGAAIWSADPTTFLRFPAATFVRFFHNHGLLERSPALQWRVVRGGSRRYVDALAGPFRERIRTACPVRRLRRLPAGAGVELASDCGLERFDRVVVAVHSDQALRMLADPSPAERQVLGAVRYQRNEVLLHTDASLLPRTRRAWASWNYRIPKERSGRAFVTYHMNRLQGLRSREQLLVTLNGGDRVDPRRVLGHFTYHHPVFDADAIAAQKHHDAIDGVNATHYCGAWWGNGFHEDGVKSALVVARKLAQSPLRGAMAARRGEES
jgi:predicted NAD/FAD-binding protein